MSKMTYNELVKFMLDLDYTASIDKEDDIITLEFVSDYPLAEPDTDPVFREVFICGEEVSYDLDEIANCFIERLNSKENTYMNVHTEPFTFPTEFYEKDRLYGLYFNENEKKYVLLNLKYKTSYMEDENDSSNSRYQYIGYDSHYFLPIHPLLIAVLDRNCESDNDFINEFFKIQESHRKTLEDANENYLNSIKDLINSKIFMK